MQERLISVLRQPQVMVALVGRRRSPFDLGSSHPEPYVEIPIALSRVSESTCPWRDKDIKAWRALANVPRMSNRAALAVIRIIIGSVADPETRPQELEVLAPDKIPSDLRPYLCDPSGEQQLLDSVADALAAASDNTPLPGWHWTHRRELGEMPAEFLRLFLWSLHLSSWEEVVNVQAAFETLELSQAPGLRSAMAQLISKAGAERGLAWAGLVYTLDAKRRTRATELIIESGAEKRAPKDSDAAALAQDDSEAWAHLSVGAGA